MKKILLLILSGPLLMGAIFAQDSLPAKTLTQDSFPALTSTQPLKGTVKSSNGQVLQGATILVKGTNNAVIADSSGNFSITRPAESPFTLVVSLVGYKPRELQIDSLTGTEVDIVLVDNPQQLAEHVISLLRG